MNKFSAFKFEFKSQQLDKKAWAKYNSLKQKTKRTEIDKFFIQDFRKKLANAGTWVTVTHIPTKISRSLLVFNKINRVEIIKEHLKLIRHRRKILKEDIIKTKEFCGASYEVVGNTFNKPNQINTIGKNCKWNDPLQSKVPTSVSKKYIGVELEFNHHPQKRHSTETIGALFKKENLGRYVHCGTDGSCGFEVRVLVTEDNYQEILPKIMKVLTDEGFPCDTRCGTHVHLDMRQRDVKQVYKNFFYTQTFLRKFLKKSRKRNTFCKVNNKDNFEEQLALRDRYLGINPNAYMEHKTLEIRMHHGTLDSNELVPWIKLLLTIANYQGIMEKKVLTLKQASEKYNMDASLKNELTNRLGWLFSLKGA